MRLRISVPSMIHACAGMQIPLDQATAVGLCVVASETFTARKKVLVKMLLQLPFISATVALFACRLCQCVCKWGRGHGTSSGELDQPELGRGVLGPLLPMQEQLEGAADRANNLHLPDCPGQSRHSAAPPRPRDMEALAVRAEPEPEPEDLHPSPHPRPCSGCRHHKAADLPLQARGWATLVNVGLTAYAALLAAVLQMVTCVHVPGKSPSVRYVLIQADVECKGGRAGLVIFGFMGVVLGPMGVWYATRWAMSGSLHLNLRLGLRNALTAPYKEDRFVSRSSSCMFSPRSRPVTASRQATRT
jgi:hypothetical protein